MAKTVLRKTFFPLYVFMKPVKKNKIIIANKSVDFSTFRKNVELFQKYRFFCQADRCRYLFRVLHFYQAPVSFYKFSY